ncbi:MAG TPA: hypothetical protein VJV78_01955, partial [Polyangiales bacterium]|nr:hypothetical protein [Polyangiales bacterium]
GVAVVVLACGLLVRSARPGGFGFRRFAIALGLFLGLGTVAGCLRVDLALLALGVAFVLLDRAASLLVDAAALGLRIGMRGFVAMAIGGCRLGGFAAALLFLFGAAVAIVVVVGRRRVGYFAIPILVVVMVVRVRIGLAVLALTGGLRAHVCMPGTATQSQG